MKKIRYKLRALPYSHPKYLRWLELFNNVSLLDYVATYTDEMEVEDNANHLEICEQLFEKFNLNHPSNYAAHSMSVSDIVEIIDIEYLSASFIIWAEFIPSPESIINLMRA